MGEGEGEIGRGEWHDDLKDQRSKVVHRIVTHTSVESEQKRTEKHRDRIKNNFE